MALAQHIAPRQGHHRPTPAPARPPGAPAPCKACQRRLAAQTRRVRARAASAALVADLTEHQQAQLSTFLDFLLAENAKYDLTAITDRAEAHERHIVDSLALLEAIDPHWPVATPEGDSAALLDVGSGAGLPGLVLAIARPHWQVTCMDATRKRVDFVNKAAELAGAINARAVAGRCEDLGRAPDMRERYAVVTARAVANAATLAELCLPFVREGGVLVAAKGADGEAEVARGANAIDILGGELVGCVPVESFASNGQRMAAVVRKVRATPDKYPRRNGIPNKRPL